MTQNNNSADALIMNNLGISHEKILLTQGKDAAQRMESILLHIKNTAGLSSCMRADISRAVLEWQMKSSEAVRRNAYIRSYEKWITTIQTILFLPDDLPAHGYKNGAIMPALYLAQALRNQVVSQQLLEMRSNAVALVLDLLSSLLNKKIVLWCSSDDPDELPNAVAVRTRVVQYIVECLPMKGD